MYNSNLASLSLLSLSLSHSEDTPEKKFAEEKTNQPRRLVFREKENE